MSVIVEPTLQYTNTDLHLEDPKRWARLFPLIRPSVKVVSLPQGQAIVVDTALANSENVLVTAIGSVGNFSSKILSGSHISAFATEPFGSETISARDVADTLKNEGFGIGNGVVVVRACMRQDLKVQEGCIEMQVIGELKMDHILSLLGNCNKETK
jgi:hypothetical protein